MFGTAAWSTSQWIAFCGLLVAGLSALGLFAIAIRTVRGWTAPAHPTFVDGPAPRPTLALAAQRIANGRLELSAAQWRAADSAGLTVTIAPTVDPTAELLPGDVAEHLAEGPGSLVSLQRVEGSIVAAEPPVDPIVHGWFVEAFDRAAHVPARSEAAPLDEGGVMTRWHTAIEPLMRTARLWEIQGRGVNGHTSGRQLLDRWHVDTPTGGWPIVPPIGGRLPANAGAW